MAQTEKAAGKAELDSKKADLDFARERLRDLAQRYPQADAAVRAAAAEVERLKTETDLRPNDRAAQEAAEHAELGLTTAIAERDGITESIERLRKRESVLASELAAQTNADLVAARAAARQANADAIDAGRAAARAWIVAAVATEMLKGTTLTDPGLAAICALEPGRHHSEAVSAVTAAAAGRRAAIERGEVLP